VIRYRIGVASSQCSYAISGDLSMLKRGLLKAIFAAALVTLTANYTYAQSSSAPSTHQPPGTTTVTGTDPEPTSPNLVDIILEILLVVLK